jgi:hypothetical protein
MFDSIIMLNSPYWNFLARRYQQSHYTTPEMQFSEDELDKIISAAKIQRSP